MTIFEASPYRRAGSPRVTPQPSHRRRTVPICVFCYHKVATVLLGKVMGGLSRINGWNFRVLVGRHTELPADADVILIAHSLIDPGTIDRPFVGVHFVRDPRDIVVSGYLYHLRTAERWCVNTDLDPTPPIRFPRVPRSQQHQPESWKAEYLRSLGGRSYQQNLRALPQAEGLLFEMHHYAGWTIDSMRAWDYGREDVLEVRFEDLMAEFDAGFRCIFSWLGLSAEQRDAALELAAHHDLGRKSREEIRQIEHVSAAETSKWRAYFEPQHKNAFRARFGEVLVDLGYETGDDW